MALVVNITGSENIEQGDQLTLTATVTDTNGNTPPGTLQYAWSTSRGSFVGATDAATAVYHADFTDTDAVDITITCAVTRPANANPTISGPSLTALAEIGVTGILVNMFVTELGAVAANANSVLYNPTTGTLDSGSDQRLSSNIRIHQLRWDNQTGFNHFVLNNNEGGSIGDFFRNNNNQSVYLIFGDGTYKELTPTDFSNANSAGGTWARWEVTDAAILALLNGLTATDDLVVGVADAGAIGWTADSGSDTDTVTAAVPLPLTIETIDEQFIPLGTKDYDLVIDITGKPNKVEATGHMEGFDYHYDEAKSQLHIRAEEVTRLIAGVFWTVKLTKGTQVLTADIAYNVVKAPPIFETLAMLHLYKDVPINIDILIQNIPNLIVPNARLLGLKSELQEYGMNIKGALPADANLTIDEGDISMIVPSETGGTSEMHDYPYEIESGSPPAIVSPTWQPKGNYGELTFTDVNHALGYEWTLETGDAAVWNFFNSTRGVINPGQVEVTPGNLNVTLKFPNVAGASSYEYMLESEDHKVDWTRFVGTFTNGMITTIIPDLPDGETLTLRLRVGSPWVGPPISIQVTGGRIAYSVHDGDSNSYLYVFHTGVADGGSASRIKRILLPTGREDPRGLAISGDLAYVVDNTDKVISVFNHADTADNDRATELGAFNLLATGTIHRIAIWEDEIYINQRYNGDFMNAYDRNSTYGANITHLRSLNLLENQSNSLNLIRINAVAGLSADSTRIYFAEQGGGRSGGAHVAPYDRQSTTPNTDGDYAFDLPNNSLAGLSVIGDIFYSVDSGGFRVFKRDPDNSNESLLIKTFEFPSGLLSPVGLDILV